MRAVALVLLLVAPLLAGCLGGDGGGGDEPVRKARAAVSDSLGGIEGIVTDAAVQPVAGATVTLVELSRTASTQDDGSFAFSQLAPGTYTVAVNATGFVSGVQDVVVRAEAVSAVEFVLAQLFTEEPFTQAFELAGFFECGFALGANLSALPAPANISTGVISWPLCAEVNGQFGNTTNDRWSHFFDLQGPIETLIVETMWEPGPSTLSDQLWVEIVEQGFHCGNITTCEWDIIDHWGENPLVGRVEREHFEEVQAYFNRRCENGVDEWCGYNFFDDGWPLWIRVYPRWECQPAGAQGCVMVQQRFDHVVTAFYNAPAPEGFSALS